VSFPAAKIYSFDIEKDAAFRLNTIKTMTPIQAYNHTISTLITYRDSLGVSRLNETKWNIWGAIYFSMTVYTTIVSNKGKSEVADFTTYYFRGMETSPRRPEPAAS
jgi:ABC-type microcin C transport system permease subunit YejE